MRHYRTLIPILLLFAVFPAPAQSVKIQKHLDGSITIENRFIKRTFATTHGRLHTSSINNKLDRKTLIPTKCDEFRLRISKGTQFPEGDEILTAADFAVQGSQTTQRNGTAEIVFSLDRKNRTGKPSSIHIKLHCQLAEDDFFIRKHLVITSNSDKPIALERIDVEAMDLETIYQPYQLKAITAQGAANWKPGLGQPLYTRDSGTFWGIEFPASYNHVNNKTLRCGYLHGRMIEPKESYTTYRSVVGVADHPDFVKDAFFEYIDRIRIRPLRLQIQYNSWFDYGSSISSAKFSKSVGTIHQKLVRERGLKPLSAYVIDDGWQNTRADWSKKVFPVNNKFDPDLFRSRNATISADSTLGIWLSPGCLFGSQGGISSMKKAGFESIDPWMSMAGPKYMAKLEERMLELISQGVTYFKLDGLFGHYITRNFELNGERYGLPSMPQLLPKGMRGNDARLNDPKYDELKTYYLAAGTERLMQLFLNMAEANPDVYIVISNGAYLSPWWLQYVDSVWMINAGDAASGSTRTEELVYRDGRYYELWEKEQTQFPICSLFNHEPKKTNSKETKDTFRRYLYMNISRGTGFIELYIKPMALQEYDWDVMAEGLEWAHAVFPTFNRSRMHGGNPENAEV